MNKQHWYLLFAAIITFGLITLIQTLVLLEFDSEIATTEVFLQTIPKGMGVSTIPLLLLICLCLNREDSTEPDLTAIKKKKSDLVLAHRIQPDPIKVQQIIDLNIKIAVLELARKDMPQSSKVVKAFHNLRSALEWMTKEENQKTESV